MNGTFSSLFLYWISLPLIICGGDIVTLLWFRPCVRPSVCAWVDLVKTIETTPLHVSLSNLADMLTTMRGWTLLIWGLDVNGKGHNGYGNRLVNTIETKLLCISISNLADMLTMVRGWTLLILEVRDQRSRSQWTYMEISLWTWYRSNLSVLLDQTQQTC